jgi:hypothetical protein
VLRLHGIGEFGIVDYRSREDAILPALLGEERIRVALPLGGPVSGQNLVGLGGQGGTPASPMRAI